LCAARPGLDLGRQWLGVAGKATENRGSYPPPLVNVIDNQADFGIRRVVEAQVGAQSEDVRILNRDDGMATHGRVHQIVRHLPNGEVKPEIPALG